MSGLATERGTFSGFASIFGSTDLAGDIVLRGSITNLDEFRRRGVFLWSHDSARPVASPVLVHEDDTGLWVMGKFHGTPDGVMARQVLSERKDDGLDWGLSIGYLVDRARKRSDGVVVLERIRLLEVSLVATPANPEARVRDVKGPPPPTTAETELRRYLAGVEIDAVRGNARRLGVQL